MFDFFNPAVAPFGFKAAKGPPIAADDVRLMKAATEGGLDILVWWKHLASA